MPHLRFKPGLLAAGVLLVSAVPASAATFSVQVEGTTLVQAPGAVASPAAVTRDGQTCPADSLVAALDTAVAGNWRGNYVEDGASFAGPTSPGIVKGESHLFGSGSYWSVYVNGQFVNGVPCDTLAAGGDDVVWFASDDPFTAGQKGFDEPLYMTGVPAVAKPGQAFSVLVREATTTFNPNPPYEGTTALTPATGGTVAGQTIGADGRATVTLAERGPQTVVATKGNRAPDRAVVCVTDGADGFCGSELAKQAEQAAACSTRGDDGLCGTVDKRPSYGFLTSISEQQRFARRRGPRELAGRVDADPSGLKDVLVRITKRVDGRCATFDAQRTRLVRMARCGAARGKWFSAGKDASWSYLLPERLSRGRYVVDVKALDGAGNEDATLARGRNRVVFHVA